MSDTADCKHLDENGICRGKYMGFGCIDDKCLDPTRGREECKHLRDDGYCTNHRKFQCDGEDCDDYEI